MGLKDYVGGDFRYYDLARMSSGLEADLRTDLTPLADWPGQDSCFIMQTNLEGAIVNHEAGWNIISIPVSAPDLLMAWFILQSAPYQHRFARLVAYRRHQFSLALARGLGSVLILEVAFPVAPAPVQ